MPSININYFNPVIFKVDKDTNKIDVLFKTSNLFTASNLSAADVNILVSWMNNIYQQGLRDGSELSQNGITLNLGSSSPDDQPTVAPAPQEPPAPVPEPQEPPAQTDSDDTQVRKISWEKKDGLKKGG